MSNEIELISDGDGVAVFGDPAAVEQLLNSAGVASREISTRRSVGSVLGSGAGVAEAASQIAAESGRWVKLTEKSAKALKLGKAMKGSSDGVSRAIATTSKGKITKILEFAKPGSIGSILTNPAMLASAAGIMAQLAMQQTMEEITEYLALIDQKVDDILRAQKDAAVAEMIGVGLVIDDAMLKREHVGRVSDVTWSSLHGAAQTIATTQAYALRQLHALAEKLEKQSKVGGLAKLTTAAEATVQEWLAVLARCFQLQDGLNVLELDRVLDASPDDLDRHRSGIRAGRDRRRDLISTSTARLISRLDAAAAGANEQVLLHPIDAARVVRSGNDVADDVVVFRARLGVEDDRRNIDAKPWREAVGDARDTVIATGEHTAQTAGRLSVRAFGHAKASTEKFAESVAERLPWRRSGQKEPNSIDTPPNSESENAGTGR